MKIKKEKAQKSVSQNQILNLNILLEDLKTLLASNSF